MVNSIRRLSALRHRLGHTQETADKRAQL